jgi:multidrug resistance protein
VIKPISDFITSRFESMKSGDAGKLGILMTTAFIDMVGGLMVFPLFPFYATKFGANGLQVSLLITAFAVMQLLSAPFWGRVSDRYGRKPALLAGLTASAISYVVFAYSSSYWMLLACRLVQGAGGGTTGVIQAYVADAVEPKNRARGLSWLSSATNLGVVLGPFLGALSVKHIGAHGPGLMAALLCMVNIWFAIKYLTERQTAKARAKSRSARKPMEVVTRVFTHPTERASRLIWMYAICMGAFYGINPVLSLYLKDYWGFTVETIGYFFVYIGAISVLVRIYLVGPVVDRFGEVRTARFGTALLALGILLVVLVPPLTSPHGARSFAEFEEGLTSALGRGIITYLPLGAAVALIPFGTAFNFPATTGLLSRVVGEHERGLYMGVQQTYAGILRAAYPLYAGFAWDHFKPIVPFGTSAALVAGTIWLGFGLNKFSGNTGEFEVADTAQEPAALAEERR